MSCCHVAKPVFVPAPRNGVRRAEPQFTRQAIASPRTRRPGGTKAVSTPTRFSAALTKKRSHSDFDRFDSRLAELHLGLQTHTSARDSRVRGVHNEYDLDTQATQDASWTMEGRGSSAAVRGCRFRTGYRIRICSKTCNRSSALCLPASAARIPWMLPPEPSPWALLRRQGQCCRRPRRWRPALARLQPDRAAPDPRTVDAFASFSRIDSDYQQQNASFEVTRHDRQSDIAVGLSWQMARGWFLRPQVLRTRNQSNVPLSDYSRTEAALTLRRVWD